MEGQEGVGGCPRPPGEPPAWQLHLSLLTTEGERGQEGLGVRWLRPRPSLLSSWLLVPYDGQL